MPATVPPDVAKALNDGNPAPAGLSDAEKDAFASLDAFYKRSAAYSAMMGTRPETISYALADSPVGQAAWIYDRFTAGPYSGGNPESSLTQDEMLDDISLYWLTNSAASTSQSYWEVYGGNPFNALSISIPVGVTVFPGEIYRAPRTWGERNYHNLIHWNEVDRGGHFAAWEQPDILTAEIRATFSSLR
jgi:pimeloyl-ACP methyl ester carboxylesterase